MAEGRSGGGASEIAVQRICIIPTEPFKISEPQNQSDDVSELDKVREGSKLVEGSVRIQLIFLVLVLRRFRSKARHLSEDLRDSPLLGSEQILYWVEHIARHKGRVHYRNSAHQKPLSNWTLYHFHLMFTFIALSAMAIAVLLTISVYAGRKIVQDFLFPKTTLLPKKED